MGSLGAHVSAAGGVSKAVDRAADLGCESYQVFVKSPNQWRAKALDQSDVDAFKAGRAAAPMPVVAHAAYLINLASPKEDVVEKSKAGLLDELLRCTAYGLDGLVLHPGAHLGDGLDAGIERIARALDEVFADGQSVTTKLLLENTAGQGSTIGAEFEELARIIALLDEPDRVGVCFDSCHAYAAGYDVSTDDGYASTFEKFGEALGHECLCCVHLNDSKFPLGSRKDRHESVGDGLIGVGFFERIVNDASLENVPLVLETPLGDDGEGHRKDLTKLRALRK